MMKTTMKRVLVLVGLLVAAVAGGCATVADSLQRPIDIPQIVTGPVMKYLGEENFRPDSKDPNQRRLAQMYQDGKLKMVRVRIGFGSYVDAVVADGMKVEVGDEVEVDTHGNKALDEAWFQHPISVTRVLKKD